jgi:hypothetical protein
MKPTTFFFALLIISLLLASKVFTQLGGQQTNQITIRSDRVFMLNGQPFFPIMLSHELGPDNYNCQLKRPQDGKLYGFNVINLHKQVKWLFRCFADIDQCTGWNWSYCDPNYKVKNIISGDLNSGGYYNSILNPIGWDINYDANANRIFTYVNNPLSDPSQNVYVLSDDYAFFTSTISHFVQNCGSVCCQDYVVMNPRATQNERNAAIDRINSLAMQSNSKLIGFFSLDDANMMGTYLEGASCNEQIGPYFTQYYFNNIDQQINELTTTYNYAKNVYPNSIVYMAIPPVFYPRALDPNGLYGSLPLSEIRLLWKDAAHRLAGATDVMYAMFFNFESPGWGWNWRLYDGDGRPSWYLEHLDVMMNEVISGYRQPKAILGGYWFDGGAFLPQFDSNFERKLKWATYVSLAKGATGLNFFGWHLGKSFIMADAWQSTQRIVDTLVNVHHLNEKVFTKTNSGPIGHFITSSLTNGNVSYAVYKINGWSEYYLLVTNNPTGNINQSEPNNILTINSSIVNWCYYDIKEIFSCDPNSPVSCSQVPLTTNHQFQYEFPWFGTALFHIKLKNPPPNYCVEERPEYNNPVNLPDRFYINQNYPNPFNPSTEISFGLPKDEFVTIEVYNSLGQKVITLLNENRPAGRYAVTFDARNYASGVYIYKMKAGNFTETKKMLLVK